MLAAARRLYRKYRMELFRFGVHVLNDHGLAEEIFSMRGHPSREKLPPSEPNRCLVP